MTAPLQTHPTFAPVRIHRGLPYFKTGQRRIATTGTFDGVHLGHRALLDWMVNEAQTMGAETLVLTFDPHPRQVLFGADSGLELIQSLDQRMECLEETGLDHLVIQPFDKEFSRLRPEDFVRDVLVEGLGITTIVVGHDHRFGAGREGDIDLLRACGEMYGFTVQLIPAHIEGELTVSSTKIRQRLRAGELAEASALLGRHPAWRGEVVHGDGRGRQLGYPTANFEALEPHLLLPAEGVYAAEVKLLTQADGSRPTGPIKACPAMVNIGPRPTFDPADAPAKLEAHLFDTKAPELYGATAEITFVEKLRDVQKFESADALVDQLGMDATAAKRILGYT